MPVFKGHLFRRRLQESAIVDVADDQLGGLTVVPVQGRLVQLTHKVLLQRFLRGDRIEKELPLFFRLLRTPAIAARLRHVIAPFLIQFGQLIELLFELRVGRGLRLFAFADRFVR